MHLLLTGLPASAATRPASLSCGGYAQDGLCNGMCFRRLFNLFIRKDYELEDFNLLKICAKLGACGILSCCFCSSSLNGPNSVSSEIF